MKLRAPLLYIAMLLSLSSYIHAEPDRAQLVVWANEAIISAYTINYKTFNQQQKALAQYFTAEGWIAYSKAMDESQLKDSIQKNSYDVTSVATQPPKLIALDPTHWIAIMPILVNYENPQYSQQQSLKISLGFTIAPEGQGIRGFAATSLQAAVIKPPCQCMQEDDTTVTQTPAKK